MVAKLRKLWCDDEGVASVEYAFLLALVAVASIAAWNRLADTVGNMIQQASTDIASGN